MASWAQVAGTGRPKHISRPDPSPIVEMISTLPKATTDVEDRKTSKVQVSKLVAVPKIAPPSRPTKVILAPPSSTAPTSAASQQNTSGSSSMTTLSPAKSTKDDPRENDRSVSPSWEYNVYVSTFAGTAMLPQHSTTSFQDASQLHIEQTLTPQSYSYYMWCLAKQEATAMYYENEKYALYNVALAPSTVHYLEYALWALSVPGLRDGRPFLEMGDTLQLRQLHMDANGNQLHFTIGPFEDLEHHPDQPRVFVGWTGRQLDACVYAVNRASEVVYLRIDGLIPLYPGQSQIPPFVNVTFPVKHTQFQVQRTASTAIGAELMKISPIPSSYNAVIQEEEAFDDFHPGFSEQDKSSDASTAQMPQQHNDWIRRMLFPTEEDGLLQTQLRKVPHRDFFDSVVNYEQAHAVSSICAVDYGILPYLISGPPGTGKTKTLVETAMQLLHTSKSTHIILCAPSEAAADTLALRLKQYLNTKQLFRLNRPGRGYYEMPLELMQYAYMDKDRFDLPPVRQLLAYNVVVTSCQDAGILHEAHLTNNDLWHVERNILSAFHPEEADAPIPSLHWSALLIDEAAQATEVEILPAINVVCPPSEHPKTSLQPLLVMAGDEHQLGPRTASQGPGFATSLFARLSQRSLYRSHPLARDHSKPSTSPSVLKKSMLPIIYPPFTNLIRNYRSHPSILSVPSSLFYNDTLIPEAPTPDTPLQHSSIWRGRGWPVLFVPNSSPDEIERDGGGWYNYAEAQVACHIAQELVRTASVQQADICIMSPFAAQVKLLRKIMRSNEFGLWDVNIGPVEAFQGLEKQVVIICTTRTRERFLEQDCKRGLGIIKQPRTMNVALTRAKEALVVLGNPAILMLDEHWKAWLAFCWRNELVARDWGVKEEDFGEQKVGVLERALVVREESREKKERALGAGTETLDVDVDRRYEAWIESLREALDEEDEEEDEFEEEEDEEYGEEKDDDEGEEVEGDGADTA